MVEIELFRLLFSVKCRYRYRYRYHRAECFETERLSALIPVPAGTAVAVQYIAECFGIKIFPGYVSTYCYQLFGQDKKVLLEYVFICRLLLGRWHGVKQCCGY